MHSYHQMMSHRYGRSTAKCARVFLCLLLMIAAIAPCMAENDAAPYSYEWFMQPDDSVPTKSCVYIHTSSSVPAQLMFDPAYDAQYVWKLHFIMEEGTGIPFTIEKLTEVTFGQDHVVLAANEYIGEEVNMLLPQNTVKIDYQLGYNIDIIPGGGETALGVAIEGTDALGNALTFTCCVPLSYEVSPVLTRAHFAAGAAQEEGKPYISITTEENPIPQIYNPVFNGDYGWEYFYTIENVTDEPFTVSRIVEAYLIGEDVVFSAEYTQEQFEEWDFSPELVKGNAFTGGSGANTQQGFDELGLLAEGVDKDGNEIVFAALIPFSKERPQE